MGLKNRTTGLSSTALAISTAVANRVPNLMSVQIFNPSTSAVIVDILDGLAGSVVDTIVVPSSGQVTKSWCGPQELGNVNFTAGNPIAAQCRSAVAGGVEVICESGRV
jgi:hypothetical protein